MLYVCACVFLTRVNVPRHGNLLRAQIQYPIKFDNLYFKIQRLLVLYIQRTCLISVTHTRILIRINAYKIYTKLVWLTQQFVS